MESEKIDIDSYFFMGTSPGNPTYFSARYYYTEYDCTYVFKNNEKAQTVLLGFPVAYGKLYSSVGRPPVNPFFDDFEVYRDGEKIRYAKYIHGCNPDIPEVLYDEVYGFDVRMEEKGRTTIRVRYSTVLQLGGWLADQCVTYILKSGRNFSKPIGKADVTVTLHFKAPENATNNYPLAKRFVYEGDPPVSVYSWSFTDFVPSEDISVKLPESIEIPEKKDGSPLVENLKRSASVSDYYELLRYYVTKKMYETEKGRKFDAEEKKRVQGALIEFYENALPGRMIEPVVKGFMLSDIRTDPSISPGEKIVANAEKDVKASAAESLAAELETLKSLSTALVEFPSDRGILEIAWKHVNNENHFDLMNFEQEYDNPYIRETMKNKEYSKLRTEVKEKATGSFSSNLDRMLGEKKDNVKEIDSLVHSMVPQPVDINRYYLDTVEKLTKELWNKSSGKDREALVLSKVLGLTMIKVFDLNTTESSILKKMVFERDLLRKGYYVVGNYYYHSDPEKAVVNYKLAFSFCRTSPLWDFFSIWPGMMAACWSWIENTEKSRKSADEGFSDCMKYYGKNENNFNLPIERVNFGLWKSDFKPWWKDIFDITDESYEHRNKPITEADIVSSYTPERILGLDLSRWEEEDYDSAPCYFIAYNTACACSVIGNAGKALLWLEVAYELNKAEIRKIAWTDPDLKRIRDGYSKEFSAILND